MDILDHLEEIIKNDVCISSSKTKVLKAIKNHDVDLIAELLVRDCESIHEFINDELSHNNFTHIDFLIQQGLKTNDIIISRINTWNIQSVKYFYNHGASINAILSAATNVFKISDFPEYELIEFCLSKGADINYRHFMSLIHDDDILNLLVDNISLQSSNKIHEIISTLFAKGNYEQAGKLYSLADTCADYNIIDESINAIKLGLKNSIENNKNHAIINLIHKAHIKLPSNAAHLVNNISDDIDEQEFEFIEDLLPQLAKHYINLSKMEFINSFKNQDLSNGNLIQINKIFQSDNHEKYEDFMSLKAAFSNNKILNQINNEFDAYYRVIGRALDILDNDFALEVLNLNGYSTSILKEDMRAYRGYNCIRGETTIEDLFKHGTKSFGFNDFQKTLSYHVLAPWNKLSYEHSTEKHLWDFGGTYVSTNPTYVRDFIQTNIPEFKTNIYLEILMKKGSPYICGMNPEEYELSPNRIEGNEIVKVYEIEGDIIKKIHINPYVDIEYTNSSLTVGDKISQYNNSEEDTENVEYYNNLNCMIPEYTDYSDFISRYKYENVRFDDIYENECKTTDII